MFLVAAATLGIAMIGPAPARAELTLLPNVSPNVADPVTTFRGSTYFLGGTGRFQGLYSNDGPKATTRRVARLEGAPSPDYTRDGLFVVRDQLVFTTTSAYRSTGFLMRSDGTAKGTRRVLKAQPRGGGSPKPGSKQGRKLSVGAPIVAGDQLYVNVEEGLEGGTFMRVDLDRGTMSPVLGADRGALGVASGPTGLLFEAQSLEGRFQTLWNAPKTGKPVPLAETKQSRTGSIYGALGDQLYFSGIDAQHGAEPWVTDGTPAGTHLVADLTPGGASTDVSAYVTVKDSVYVVSMPEQDGVYGGPQRAHLLTGPAGPAPVTFDGAPIVTGQGVATADGVVFTTGTGAQFGRIRVAAGSAVAESVPGSATDENGALIVPGGPIYASADTLRVTDAAGTTTILATTGITVNGKTGEETSISDLTLVDGTAWFRAPAVDGGGGLWRSDGTAAGTYLIVGRGQLYPVTGRLEVRRPRARDDRAPYSWTVGGSVALQSIPAGSAPGLCRGKVNISTLRYGSTVVLHREPARLRWNGTACTFRRVVTPGRTTLRAGGGRLVLQVAFDATDYLRGSNTLRFSVRYPAGR